MLDESQSVPPASNGDVSAGGFAPDVTTGTTAAKAAALRVASLGRTIRKLSLYALLEEQVTEGSHTSVPTLPEALKLASFGVDPALHRQAALVLARAEHYIAAKNYLQLYLLYEPMSTVVDQDLMRAVTDSRPVASRRASAFTWDTFPADWRTRLRIAHLLLIGDSLQRQPSADLRAWIKMLIVSPALFGGPASHLLCALAELVKVKLGDPHRFEPPAKVLALGETDKHGRNTWLHGVLLPPEDEGQGAQGSGSAASPKKNVASKETSGGAASPKKSMPAAKRASNSARGGANAGRGGAGTGVSSPAPKWSAESTEVAAAQAQAAAEAQEAAAAQEVLAAAKAVKDPPPLRVKLKATNDAPQRIIHLKRGLIMRDVEASTPKAYVPGLILLQAAALGRNEILLTFLDAGIPSTEVDEEANNALLHASFNCTTDEHRQICRHLVDRGMLPDVMNLNGMSPWDCAMLRKDTALRRIFRPSESDRDFTQKARWQTELHRAIDAGDEDIALAELSNPGNLEVARIHGVSPLMTACRVGMQAAVQALLNRGVNSAATSEHGCTALSIAAEEGRLDILQDILQASGSSKSSFVADVSDTNPLMRACENGHVQCAALLLQCSSADWNVNSVNKKGWTALMIAAFNGFDDIAGMLLASGARTDILKKDAKLHSKGGKYSALCYACLMGRTRIVLSLISDDSADLTLQKGETALSLAEEGEHEQCAAALRAAGAEGCENADRTNAHAEPEATEAAKGPALSNGKQGTAQRSAGRPAGASAPATDSTKPGKVEKREKPKSRLVSDPSELTAKLQALELKESELNARLFELKEQLKARRTEKKLRLASMSAEERAIQRRAAAELASTKSPWAFSPSGKWRPGLWQGPLDRSQPCHDGEPAHSIAFVDSETPSFGLLTA